MRALAAELRGQNVEAKQLQGLERISSALEDAVHRLQALEARAGGLAPADGAGGAGGAGEAGGADGLPTRRLAPMRVGRSGEARAGTTSTASSACVLC